MSAKLHALNPEIFPWLAGDAATALLGSEAGRRAAVDQIPTPTPSVNSTGQQTLGMLLPTLAQLLRDVSTGEIQPHQTQTLTADEGSRDGVISSPVVQYILGVSRTKITLSPTALLGIDDVPAVSWLRQAQVSTLTCDIYRWAGSN